MPMPPQAEVSEEGEEEHWEPIPSKRSSGRKSVFIEPPEPPVKSGPQADANLPALLHSLHPNKSSKSDEQSHEIKESPEGQKDKLHWSVTEDGMWQERPERDIVKSEGDLHWSVREGEVWQQQPNGRISV
jgi:hypothetical protein